MTLSDFQIKINPQYSQLVRALSNKEYTELKESIKEKGLHLPIIINQENIILDGHHRYQICNELDIEPKYEVMMFQDLLEEKQFVIDINDKRRQLNDFAKSELAYKLEEIESEKARLRSLNNLKNVKDNLSTAPIDAIDQLVGKVSKIVSKKIGVSQGTYERAKFVIKHGPDHVKQKLREGRSTINKEYEKIRKDQKRTEFRSQMKYNSSIPSSCKILQGDFKELAKDIPNNSIDLIPTDPPYADTEENLSLYNELAVLARDKLRPGASLVFLVGHINLNKIIRIFDSYENDLKYWWTFAVKHSSNHTKIHARHIFAQWKPMLWYVKGDKGPNEFTTSNTIGDFIESDRPKGNKIMHKWEQSTIEFEYIIRKLTLETQMVLDPMLGTGSSAVASIKLNRKFIGFEKNPETFEIAKARISAIEK